MDSGTSPQGDGAVSELSLPIGGMTCASCVARVERVLSRVPGVAEVRVNLATERAELRVRASVTRGELANAVERAGYSLGAETDAFETNVAPSDVHALLLRPKVVLAACLSLPVFAVEMVGHMVPEFHHWVFQHLGRELVWLMELVLSLAVMLGPGRDIFRHGLKNLVRLAPDMNSLVALGTGSAFGYSAFATLLPEALPVAARHVYFESASVVITLILLGKYFESKSKSQTSEAIRKLVRLRPSVALVRRGTEWVSLDVKEVQVGDLVLLKPGERVAVDGVVVEGASHVDEAMLTGEPVPVNKTVGAKLSAGTVNQSGGLTMRTTAVGARTLLGQIVHMVEQAQASKLPIQALVDRVTLWFVPVVMGVALLTFGVWYFFGPEPRFAMALVSAVSVLIIACPCAMGLATPTSILVATGRGAEMGLLFRQGAALERLQNIRVVALDKTGTLTLGRPELTDWRELSGFSRETVLPWVSALESRSEHPVAQAIVRSNPNRATPLPTVHDFVSDAGLGVRGQVEGHLIQIGSLRYLTNSGVSCESVGAELDGLAAEGKTALLVGVDGVLAAAIAVSDPVRPEAKEAIRSLQNSGLRVAIISGDSEKTAQAVASTLGIVDVVAGVLPAGKVEAMRRLRKQYGEVAFVGDGINDAPVLAEADVGIAIGGGTDIAVESADVVLMRSDLSGVPDAILLSRAALRNIRENLFWAFAYNVALIPVAAGILYPQYGIVFSPVFGGLAMAMSSVFVVGNALRLRRFKSPGTGGPTPPVHLREVAA